MQYGRGKRQVASGCINFHSGIKALFAREHWAIQQYAAKASFEQNP